MPGRPVAAVAATSSVRRQRQRRGWRTGAERASDSYRRAAAVGGQGGSGHIARLVRGEEGDDLGDLLDLRTPSEQRGRANLLDEGRLLRGAEHRPATTALARTPRGLNSAAQDRVMELRAALVAP